MSFTSPLVKRKIDRIISALRDSKVPGDLFIEGSHAKGTADQYSDIDLCLEVDKKNYDSVTIPIGNILRSLDKPLYILDYGEDPKFPGYYYSLAMYKDLGAFQIVDLCIREKGEKHFRGERILLYSQKSREKLLPLGKKKVKRLSMKQRKIVKFYFTQPGIVKKILRKESSEAIQKAFELKLINQIKLFCSKQEIDRLNEILKKQEWIKAFKRGLKLFDARTKKYQPTNTDFRNLKRGVEGLSQLFNAGR